MMSPERSRSMGETTTTATMTSPRISFSAEFMDDDSFISISPGSSLDKDDQIEIEREIVKNAAAEFEFLSGKNSLDAGHSTMLTADELFFEGKLLPYWQINHAAEKLTKINLKSSSPEDDAPNNSTGKMKLKNNNITTTSRDQQATASAIMLGRDQQEPRIWFVDDDPSPRPPK
uniref:Uncharacterized protein n=2 Tax=Chenopodium quinoa TaxID=63459 RepID=A0A803N106_CHEQI